MTADEPIKEIQNLEFQEEIPEVKNEVVPVRRGNQDVELTRNGEVIQMPCYDVSLMRQRFQLEEHGIERHVSNDRARGTIDQLTCLTVGTSKREKIMSTSFLRMAPGRLRRATSTSLYAFSVIAWTLNNSSFSTSSG